ncbi:outer membrane beta-barrel family protein [Aureibaculum luteum]|uniref:outer membrane beta-barrel family protein n=1 Tax=Aureibaculum luteum TaxID=1548456 RepID=UPI000E468FBF|nr:outer membrane beta-barrel family protein [Aureibaculum luteum]
MRKLKLIILILFTCSMYCFSQATYTISGLVSEANGNGLPFANVLLLQSSDSTLVKGIVTLKNGTYTLDNINQGNYLIMSSIVGYQSAYSKPINLSANYKVETLVLIEGEALNEVEVVAKKQLYEQKIDRMVINVSSSIIATGSSALEVLERSPGVIVNRQNNAISLVGKSGVVVMINGKESYMPASSVVQMLQGMSSDNIESIELITTPPANFDAEGNAGFINIILKTRTDVGLNGSYSFSFGVGNGSVTSDNISFNYRKNKINIFGNYSFFRQTQGELFEFERSFINEDGIPVNVATVSDRDPNLRYHNIRSGLDYKLSDKSVIGFLLWASDSKWTMDAANMSRELLNESPNSFIELMNTERNQHKHFGSNINFKHNFKDDAYISIDLDYLKYEIENPTNYTNSFFDENNNFLREELTKSDKTNPINITVGKADYSGQISDKIKLGIGLKAAFNNFNNDVVVGAFEGQNFIEDPELTNISKLEERILAGYSSIDYAINDIISLQLGLRYEHTDSELNSDKQGKVVDRAFGEFFPTAYLSYKVNDSLNFNASYSRRITRPTFNDMAPFVIFFDPGTFFAGNASIQPAISNSVKFDVNYRSVILSAQYSIEDGTIARFQSSFDEENERLVFAAANIDRTKIFSLTLGLPITVTHWWKMQNNFIYSNTKFSNTVDGSLSNFEKNTININCTQSFTMAKNLTSEISVNYNSPSLNSFIGTSTLKSIFGINLGIQKKFGDKWGTLGFKVNDLMDSMKWEVTNSVPEQNLNTNSTFDFMNRTFMLTYSRNFGNKKLKSARERDTGAEEEKQRLN